MPVFTTQPQTLAAAEYTLTAHEGTCTWAQEERQVTLPPCPMDIMVTLTSTWFFKKAYKLLKNQPAAQRRLVLMHWLHTWVDYRCLLLDLPKEKDE